MISYQIEFKDSAAKSLAKLPKKIHRRIQGVIITLATNPLPPASTKLTGRDAYRIRVSDYRIIYSINENILTIVVVQKYLERLSSYSFSIISKEQ